MNPSTDILDTESPPINNTTTTTTTIIIISSNEIDKRNNDDENNDDDGRAAMQTTSTKISSSKNNNPLLFLSRKTKSINKSNRWITSYCNPKPWHHALYHTTTSVLCGCVVASFPLGFAYMQWPGAILLFVASTVCTFYSGWCLIELQILEDTTYSDIANRCMSNHHGGSKNFANRFVRPFQLLIFVVVTVLIVLVIGWGYMAFDNERNNNNNNSADALLLSQSGWIGIAGITYYLIFAFIPKLSQQWMLSLAGTLSGIAITVMIIVGSAISIVVNNDEGGDSRRGGGESENTIDEFGRAFDTTTEYIFGVFNAFGIIALAYGGHSVLPDIQSSLNCCSSSHENETTNDDNDKDTSIVEQQQQQQHRQKEMKKGLIGAYCIIVPCYLIAGIMGYAAFGSHVSGFVIDDMSVHVSSAFIILAWIFLIINAIAVGCVYGQAAFTLIDDILFPPTINDNNPSGGDDSCSNHCRSNRRSNNNNVLPQQQQEATISANNNHNNIIIIQNNEDESSSPSTNATSSILQPRCCRTLYMIIRHVLIRLIYVSICTLIAAAFPFFADLGGLIGAIGFIPLTFIYPLIFWNYHNYSDVDYDNNDDDSSSSNATKEENNNNNKCNKWRRIYFNWFMIGCWTIIGICGMIGSTYFIIQDSSTFGIFPKD